MRVYVNLEEKISGKTFPAFFAPEKLFHLNKSVADYSIRSGERKASF
jgi:hypothetical protein